MDATLIYPDDYPNWFRHRFTRLRPVRRLALRAKMLLKGGIDRFLLNVSHLVHLGAHHGGERFRYDALGLHVTWIEANPAAFARLSSNLAGVRRQRALHALVADEEGLVRRFHLASHAGSASSMFERHLHRELFPLVAYDRAITMPTSTLPALLAHHQIRLGTRSALVMDIQGAELLALRGARSILEKFTYIKTETANLEAYVGGCLEAELDAFLRQHRFAPVAREKLARLPDGRGLSDVLYRRQPA